MKGKKTRYAGHEHDLIHTFGVSDYDAYWISIGMTPAMRSIHRRIIPEIRRLADPPAKILELGPGPGHLYRSLRESGYDVYAGDVSKAALEVLKAPPGRSRQVDLNREFPAFGTPFAVILASLLLHHLDHPEDFLKGARNALLPGGHLLLTVPNIVTWRHRLRMLRGYFPKLSPSHRNFMTPAEVKKLLARTGLPVVRCPRPKWRPLQQLSPTLFSRELVIIARKG